MVAVPAQTQCGLLFGGGVFPLIAGNDENAGHAAPQEWPIVRIGRCSGQVGGPFLRDGYALSRLTESIAGAASDPPTDGWCGWRARVEIDQRAHALQRYQRIRGVIRRAQ